MPTNACSSTGIEIYEYQPTMMHTKTMVVDGAWSMFGSANFDNRSLELNDEMNVARERARPRRGASCRTSSRICSTPKRLELDAWRQRSLLEKDARELLELLRGDVLTD